MGHVDPVRAKGLDHVPRALDVVVVTVGADVAVQMGDAHGVQPARGQPGVRMEAHVDEAHRPAAADQYAVHPAQVQEVHLQPLVGRLRRGRLRVNRLVHNHRLGVLRLRPRGQQQHQT